MIEHYVLCAPPRCSCPEIWIDTEKRIIDITDDYEGKVKLTFDEMQMLVDKLALVLKDMVEKQNG